MGKGKRQGRAERAGITTCIAFHGGGSEIEITSDLESTVVGVTPPSGNTIRLVLKSLDDRHEFREFLENAQHLVDAAIPAPE